MNTNTMNPANRYKLLSNIQFWSVLVISLRSQTIKRDSCYISNCVRIIQ